MRKRSLTSLLFAAAVVMAGTQLGSVEPRPNLIMDTAGRIAGMMMTMTIAGMMMTIVGMTTMTIAGIIMATTVRQQAAQ